jgi:hypothetical protein
MTSNDLFFDLFGLAKNRTRSRTDSSDDDTCTMNKNVSLSNGRPNSADRQSIPAMKRNIAIWGSHPEKNELPHQPDLLTIFLTQ